MEKKIEMFEKMLDETANKLYTLKSKNTNQINAAFHNEVTVTLKELLAYAEEIEASLAVRS